MTKNIFLKTIAFILVQVFLCLDLAWAAHGFAVRRANGELKSTLGPKIRINSPDFLKELPILYQISNILPVIQNLSPEDDINLIFTRKAAHGLEIEKDSIEINAGVYVSILDYIRKTMKKIDEQDVKIRNFITSLIMDTAYSKLGEDLTRQKPGKDKKAAMEKALALENKDNAEALLQKIIALDEWASTDITSQHKQEFFRTNFGAVSYIQETADNIKEALESAGVEIDENFDYICRRITYLSPNDQGKSLKYNRALHQEKVFAERPIVSISNQEEEGDRTLNSDEQRVLDIVMNAEITELVQMLVGDKDRIPDWRSIGILVRLMAGNNALAIKIWKELAAIKPGVPGPPAWLLARIDELIESPESGDDLKQAASAVMINFDKERARQQREIMRMINNPFLRVPFPMITYSASNDFLKGFLFDVRGKGETFLREELYYLAMESGRLAQFYFDLLAAMRSNDPDLRFVAGEVYEALMYCAERKVNAAVKEGDFYGAVTIYINVPTEGLLDGLSIRANEDPLVKAKILEALDELDDKSTNEIVRENIAVLRGKIGRGQGWKARTGDNRFSEAKISRQNAGINVAEMVEQAI